DGIDENGPTDFWVPLQTRADLPPWGSDGQTFYDATSWWFVLLAGRLAPGVTEQRALAQLQPVFEHSAYEGIGQPEAGEKPPQLSFASLRGIAGLRDALQQPLRVLMGMVMLVLIIACSNVAMLLMARNMARQREFS